MSKEEIVCCQCGIAFDVPARWKAARYNDGELFYCPNGHGQVYPKGQSEADKFRREAERLRQQIAQRDDAITAERQLRERAEREAAAQKGLATKARKRAAAGVCQCCNRTFPNVQQHMAEKHPQFVCDEGVNVVPMKRKRKVA